VADRAFPSRTLFRTLRAPMHVHADGQDLQVRALLA
jgi:hypothetical protein